MWMKLAPEVLMICLGPGHWTGCCKGLPTYTTAWSHYRSICSPKACKAFCCTVINTWHCTEISAKQVNHHSHTVIRLCQNLTWLCHGSALQHNLLGLWQPRRVWCCLTVETEEDLADSPRGCHPALTAAPGGSRHLGPGGQQDYHSCWQA